mgnify:CR=1 FL=1
MVALGPDTVTWTIFARGSPISLNLEISTGLGGEFWDEKCVGILGAWNPRLLDSSVGKSQDQATNKQTAVLMEAPIYPLFWFPLSGTCFLFFLSATPFQESWVFHSPILCFISPTTSQEAFSIEPNSPYLTQPVIL